MSTTNAPFGFRLARQPLQHGNAREFPIASGLAVNIFAGDAVKLVGTIGTSSNGGQVDLATTDGTRTGTASGVPVLGIFMGCTYTDSEGRPVKANYWPSGTVASDAQALVAEGALNEYVVQADGAIAAIKIGSQVDITGFSAPGGSTTTGRSLMTVSATPVADDAQGQFQILEFVNDGKNVAGDTYTQVIVRIANPQLGQAGRTAQNAAGT